MSFNHSLGALMLASLAAVTAAPAGPLAPLEYNRDVRPILSENCFACHGADSASRKAKLRLDKPEEATAKHEDTPPAIVPGRPAESELVRRIFDEGDDLMPPEKSHKVLTAPQKEKLKRWVAEGAKYQPHWSFIAPQRPPLPTVNNPKWVRNPIDNFILARLDAEKLSPTPEADRRTLARRVTLDLTGLPPQPADVEAFVADKSPAAYEKLVDRLLASPQWGEHRARYWLDAARYGDTHGIHIDNYRENWIYRDRVIAAFNENQPFDQFTVEQLAGDLLPNATRAQQIASGFNRCNITTSEGGAIDEEYLVLYARDRTETTAQVWLGLTAGCAVCHDHKYDPISQKEFYSLTAFFNNTTQKAMDGNVKDTPPVLFVPSPEDDARWPRVQSETAANEINLAERKKNARLDFDAWLAKPELAKLNQRLPTDNLLFHAPLDDGEATALKVTVSGSARELKLATNAITQPGAIATNAFIITATTTATLADVGDFERTNAFSYGAWVKLPEGDYKNGSLFARMRDMNGKQRGWDLWLEGGRPAFHLVNVWPEDALKVIGNKELPKNKWVHVCVTYNGSSKARGVKIFVNGEPQEVKIDRDTLKSTIRTESPFKIGGRDNSSLIEQAGLQDLRIYDRALTVAEVRALTGIPRLRFFAAQPADSHRTNEVDELYPTWLSSVDPRYQELSTEKVSLKTETDEIHARGTVAHVMHERDQASVAYLLNRGEYDQRRDQVAPGTPAALPPMAADLPRNRLGFARWLLQPDNPLTARVTVNRFWQELFGAGIVLTTGDFGVAGEMPSHPELLDWLAVDFREHGWDVKKFFKLMVMSATYRQSAIATPEKIARDPLNKLLARGPRFRMDAEMVRDNALAASGLLVPKIGGPSVKPYQPDGVWEAVAMPESNTKIYQRDSGEGLYRRSLYTFWKRSAPPASMDIFNAPSRQTCTVRRERTDTPLQALVTLNDPQFVEAARHLAQLALTEAAAKTDARLDFMAERLLARPLKSNEKKIVEAGLKDLLAYYQHAAGQADKLLAVGDSKPDAKLDHPTLAAYTMVANELMNLDAALIK